MKLISRAILLTGLFVVSASLPVWCQQRQNRTTDEIRNEVKTLEAISLEGKSATFREIHKHALLDIYEELAAALSVEIEDLKKIRGAVNATAVTARDEIARELERLTNERTELVTRMAAIRGSSASVVDGQTRPVSGPRESPAENPTTTGAAATGSTATSTEPFANANVAAVTSGQATASSTTSIAEKCKPPANPGQASTSLAADLNCRVREAARAKIEQRDASKQAEAPSTSANSTSLVDTSSAGDLVNIGLSLAGLTGSTKDSSKEANSVSVTTSAYSLYAAFKGADPLNPGFYNRNSSWRKLSFTLGYDDEKVSGTTTTEQARIFGVKYLIVNRRDPALQRNQRYFDLVANSLQTAALAFGNLDRRVSYYFLTNTTVREKIILPQFRTFLTAKLDALQGRTDGPSVAAAGHLRQLLDSIEAKGPLFNLNANGVPPIAITAPGGQTVTMDDGRLWSPEEREFYANFRAAYFSSDYRRKIKDEAGQKALDDLDAFIDKQLTDTKAYENLSDVAHEALDRIRRAPQFSVYFLTRQRPQGDDEYTGETIFDYGVADRVNLTLNGSFLYRNSRLIGGDTRGGKFSGEFRFRLTPDKLTGRNPLFFFVSGDGDAQSGRKPLFHAQAKLNLPLLNGLDLPFALTYANRDEQNKRDFVKFQFGFAIDTSRILQGLIAK